MSAAVDAQHFVSRPVGAALLRRHVGRARPDRPGPVDRRLPPVRLDPRGPRRCGSGSPARPPLAGLDLALDRAGNQWAWWGDPDAAARTGRPAAWSSARTWTRSPTAAPSTARSAWSPRSPRSTRCAPPGSRRDGRSASPASPTRRAPGSASPAPGRGCITGALDADRALGADATPTATTMAEAMRGGRPRPGAASAATPRRCAGSAPSSSCTSSRAAAWSTSTLRPGRPRGCRQRHLAARPLAARLPGRGQPRRHHPARRTATTRCSSSPRSSSPPGRRPTRHGCVATVGKVRVEPDGVNAIPSHVTAWLDARGADEAAVRRVVADLRGAAAAARRHRHRGVLDRRPPGSTPTCWRASRPRSAADAPVLGTGAGHDAGHPRRRRDPDRDAVRPQPDRRLPLPGRARRARRLPGRGRRARRGAHRPVGGGAS